MVSRTAGWMVNLKPGFEKGSGDWPLFLLQISHKFYNNQINVFLSLNEKVGLSKHFINH